MPLNYQIKDGIEYAKDPGVSYRTEKGVRKKGAVYLGRVIDKDKRLFYNKSRGVFHYDEYTRTFSEADQGYLELLKADKKEHRKQREPRSRKIILDFGDAFFIDTLIKSIKYDTVLQSIGCDNTDTLFSLLLYYIITDNANSHAETWWEGSYASVLYPKAQLNSRRISEFLKKLGEEERQRKFFEAHISWLKENICNDPAILIDSTGLPNSIHFPLAGISNHNGIISREVRMTTVVQRDSGFPMMYRLAPGNVVDVSTLTRTVIILSIFGVNTDMAILDAGYYSDGNVDQLYDAGIDFITRLPENNWNTYSEIKEKCLPDLMKKENLIDFNGRYVYMNSCEVMIGSKKNHTAYGYLGYDVDRASDEIHKAIEKAPDRKTTLEAMHNKIQESGLFEIISALPFKNDEMLPAYYVRQLAEQYFDIGKGISRMIPLRVHSEESVKGHLMLSQMAATINVYIQQKMKKYYDNREDILMSLRNQKCEVYDTKIVTREGVRTANEYYKTFDIDCPKFIQRKNGQLVPKYDIADAFVNKV